MTDWLIRIIIIGYASSRPAATKISGEESLIIRDSKIKVRDWLVCTTHMYTMPTYFLLFAGKSWYGTFSCRSACGVSCFLFTSWKVCISNNNNNNDNNNNNQATARSSPWAHQFMQLGKTSLRASTGFEPVASANTGAMLYQLSHTLGARSFLWVLSFPWRIYMKE